MTKRQKLNYNDNDLVQNLQDSTGQGVDAFFSSPPPIPPSKAERIEQIQEDESEHVRTHAHTDISTHTNEYRQKSLGKMVLAKKHLSSFTFRFQSRELEKLDRIVTEINEESEQKISKNDVVRLGLNWLLRDYEENRDDSLIANVFRYT